MPNDKLCYSNLSDLELFGLIKKEDLTAFEELYHRYWAVLTDSVYKRLQSKQKAEDLVQDLFIDVFQKRNTIEFKVSVKAYLHQAIKYKVLNEFRSDTIKNNYTKSLFFGPLSKNDFANHLEAKDLKLRINQVMSKLPEKCRKAFLLSRNENLSNKEISSSMNISVSTVEKHIGKALKMFRDSLKDYSSFDAVMN